MQKQMCRLLAVAVVSSSLASMAGAQTIKTTINFSFPTQGIAANPTTNKIYVVAPNNGTQPTDNLAVIDGSADTVSQTISVPAGSQYVAVDYLANRIYVTGCNSNESPAPCTVTAIDGKKNAVVGTVLLTTKPGFGIAGIAANPVNGLVYVANGNDNVVDIVDGCKSKLIGTIDMQGNAPAAIAVNPVLNRLYVPFGTDLTAVVDTSARKIIATEVFGFSTMGVAVNVVNGHVFVTDQESFGPSMTGVFNAKGSQLASPTVDDAPLGVDVDPITNLAFVASTAQDDVTVIDGSTNTVKTTVFNVPASYLSVNFATQKIYVSGRTGVTVVTEK